jgi:hypothetical protein
MSSVIRKASPMAKGFWWLMVLSTGGLWWLFRGYPK